MPERPSNLPDFNNPPVTEVVLGTQFDMDKPLQTMHIGMYFQRIKKDFPNFEDHPPLLPQREILNGERGRMSEQGLQFVSGPPPIRRCWLKDRSGNRLIQIQGDRFLHNWRKVSDEEPYPRYESIKDEFFKRWEDFCRFLEENDLGKPKINQCELTYVNHLEQDAYWKTVDDLSSIFKFWKTAGNLTFLQGPESFFWHVQFQMPEKMGRLHIDLRPAIRSRDAKRIFQLTLTARGPVSQATREGLEIWFGTGREWIVKGFADITTEHAHQIWKRKT